MSHKSSFLYAVRLISVFSIYLIGVHDNLYAGSNITEIIHYSREDFKADAQFWAMAEDDEGYAYFGNNDGVIGFDGESWDLIRLSNHSAGRALHEGKNGKIYVGGFGEFGWIEKDSFGIHYYHSLVDSALFSKYDIGHIWAIHDYQDHIIFRSKQLLIILKGNETSVLQAKEQFHYSAVLNQGLIIQDGDFLYSLNLSNSMFTKLMENPQLTVNPIIAITEGSSYNELIIFQKKGHSFTFNYSNRLITNRHSYFDLNSQDQFFCGLKSRKTRKYYVGTVNNKMLEIDFQSGRPEVNYYNEIQNKTILALYESKNGNIWAMLNEGIDCIVQKPVLASLLSKTAIYDFLEYDGQAYIATNQGLLTTTTAALLNKKPTELIDGLEAQTWSIDSLNDQLLVGHDNGLFVLDSKTQNVKHVAGTSGVWKILAIRGSNDYYFACSYSGLYLISSKENKLITHVDGFELSVRDIMQIDDSRSFWVPHSHKGVFKLDLSENLTKVTNHTQYGQDHGLPSMNNIEITIWQGDTIFTTEKGAYIFNSFTNKFEPHPTLNKILGNQPLSYLMKKGDLTWFIQDKNLGYFKQSLTKHIMQLDIFSKLSNAFITSVSPVYETRNDETLIGTSLGLFYFDKELKNVIHHPPALFSKVTYTLKDDNKKYGRLNNSPKNPLILPHNNRVVQFDFSVPGFSYKHNIQYSYKLEPKDENWSSWDSNHSQAYSYLQSGDYVFRVKAKSITGETSKEAEYHFNIAKPWYLNRFALIGYGALSGLFMIMIFLISKRKIKRTKTLELEKREILELKIKQMQLEREKLNIGFEKKQLEHDIEHKNKELSNYTMLLSQKNALMSELHEKTKELKKQLSDEKNRKIVNQIENLVRANLKEEEHLKLFDVNFEKVNKDFFNTIRKKYPYLTPKEQRLCAFVKMNLSNKDIATILNISLRGVEAARYRIRKRLNLDKDQNMVEFLTALSTEEE